MRGITNQWTNKGSKAANREIFLGRHFKSVGTVHQNRGNTGGHWRSEARLSDACDAVLPTMESVRNENVRLRQPTRNDPSWR
jgi:hypothetical protein